MLVHHAATGFDGQALLITTGLVHLASLALLLRVVLTPAVGYRATWIVVLFAVVTYLSLAQYRNILWAFQFPWFFIGLLLTASLSLLRRYGDSADRLDLALAVICAGLATFSSTQGLLLWIAGAVFIVSSRQGTFAAPDSKRRALVAWGAGATVFMAAFAAAYASQPTGGGPGVTQTLVGALSTPLEFGMFYLTHLGAMFGDERRPTLALAAGAILMVFFSAALYRAHAVRDLKSTPVALALAAFALGFAVLVALGRARFGMSSALDLRYTAYLPLLLIAILCILFERKEGEAPAWGAVRVLYVLFLTLAVCIATQSGIVGANKWRLEQNLALAAMRSFEKSSDVQLERLLFGNAELVRKEAAFLKARAFSGFAPGTDITADAIAYVQMPASMRDLIERFPEQRRALSILWDVYVVGPDLRSAFDVLAPDFAVRLTLWAAAAARQGDHYLSRFLQPVTSDLELVASKSKAT